jgi:hypothetical protein
MALSVQSARLIDEPSSEHHLPQPSLSSPYRP